MWRRSVKALFVFLFLFTLSNDAHADWEYVDAQGQSHRVTDDLSAAEIEEIYQRTFGTLSEAEGVELRSLRKVLSDLHFHQQLLERPGFFGLSMEAQRPIRQQLWHEANRLEQGFASYKKLGAIEAEVNESVRRIDQMERKLRALNSELKEGREDQTGRTRRLTPEEAEDARGRIRNLETKLREFSQRLVAQRGVLENLKAAPKIVRALHEQVRRVRADSTKNCQRSHSLLVTQ